MADPKKDFVPTAAQIAAHVSADKLDWANVGTNASGSKSVSSAYSAIQANIEDGLVDLTPRDRKLIDSAASFIKEKTGKTADVARQVRNTDDRNYGDGGQEVKILPLPQTPTDVEALAKLHSRSK